MSDLETKIEEFRNTAEKLRAEIAKTVVGHGEPISEILTVLFAGGHALLQGVPGLGKTLLVRTIAGCLDLEFGRVQCTPDLMPADILGTNVIREGEEGGAAGRKLGFEKGPVFTNVLLADEVNRATPKTQSALLEAMEEGAVTSSGVRRELPKPFVLLATQNPIEMEGTYPLPEAQLDRFLFMVKLTTPEVPDVIEVLRRTTGVPGDAPGAVLDAEGVLAFRELVRRVVLPDPVAEHAARIVAATHPEGRDPLPTVARFLRYGASPRGAQALVLAGRVNALLDGRANVAFEDVRLFARPALRHRLIRNFEGEAEGVDTDEVIAEILNSVSEPS